MNKFLNFIKSKLEYKPNDTYDFNIEESNNVPSNDLIDTEPKDIFETLNKNLDFLRYKYNALISNDIMIRQFNLLVQNIKYDAFIIYIDGMVDANAINNFVLKPLMLRSDSNTFENKQKKITRVDTIDNIKIKQIKNELKKPLEDFILNNLIPQNSVKKTNSFSDVFTAINMGDCMLFVNSLAIAFDIDVKGFKQREINTPNNEVVIRGSQEGFVENIRTNTSILRRLINNENLVFESTRVGKLTKTQVTIGYIKNLANSDLVSEVSYRVNSLDIDYLVSSGQLEQLIQDSPNSIFPQIIATERPDKVTNFLLEGRVVILINGSPYALVVPGTFTDFLTSPEDLNLKSQYANLEKFVRFLATLLSMLLPGIYIAVTSYHQELIPTELLFTIAAAREAVPFPTFIDILLMEISFELIREAGLRVPSPLGATIGIVGTLILGEAAVSASLVSPILIIVVAITAICSYSIPDFSLSFTFRLYRFLYMVLGFLAGFFGIGIGIFIQLILMCNLKSFGVPYLTPFTLGKNKRSISSYFVPPIWKREKTSDFLHAQKQYSQGKISMVWRKNK